jgi:ribosomal protein S18 acetylase RimI-like enzyme
MSKAAKRSGHGIAIREMRVDDIAKVYRLGRRLFKSQEASTFYRTWDAYEVTNNFNLDPHLTLVAASRNGTIVGFALGTTLWRRIRQLEIRLYSLDRSAPSWQGGGLGKQLYHEMERRMHEEGVRMAFVDTARSNTGAIKFFKRMGYGKPEAEVWMRKILQRTRKVKNNQDSSLPDRHRARFKSRAA